MAITTAVALAAAGIAVEGITSAKSFIDADKSRDAAARYQADASRMMEEAKKGLSSNFYKGISLPLDAYKLQSEAALSAGAQAIQAGGESERGIAATAGRIQAQQNEAQAGIRTDQANTMLELDKLTAQEDSRLRDVGVGIDLSRAAGAQLAARDAQEAAAAQTAQGFASATSAVAQGIDNVPLFQKSQAVKDFGKLQSSYESAAKAGTLGTKYLNVDGTAIPFNEALQKIPGMGDSIKGISNLNPMQVQDFFIQDPNLLKNARGAGWSHLNEITMPNSPINNNSYNNSFDVYSLDRQPMNPFIYNQ